MTRAAIHLVIVGAARQSVLPGAARQRVIAAPARQHVIAIIAAQLVAAIAALQQVAPGAARDAAIDAIGHDDPLLACIEQIDLPGAVQQHGARIRAGDAAQIQHHRSGSEAQPHRRVLRLGQDGIVERHHHAGGGAQVEFLDPRETGKIERAHRQRKAAVEAQRVEPSPADDRVIRRKVGVGGGHDDQVVISGAFDQIGRSGQGKSCHFSLDLTFMHARQGITARLRRSIGTGSVAGMG